MKGTAYYTHYKGEFIEVPPIEKCVNSILSRIESYEDTIKRLKEENRKLKDEVWKDEELQNMKEQLDKMKSDYNRGFNITEEEDTAIKEWKKKHEEEVHGLTAPTTRMNAHGAVGGGYSYIFYPTAIGCAGVVKCNACGEEFVFSHLG